MIESNLWAWRFAGKYFTDFYLETDATQVGGPDAADYGVIFRFVDRDNFYVFEVSGNRNYSFGRRQDGNYTALIRWTYSDAINGGKATNRLGVKVAGDRFTFYVNGKQLATFTDKTFQGGDVGLIVGTPQDKGNAHVSFTNLTVRPVE
ncbi:MAG: hypothetical protein N2204_07180 [Anaerolineae bacterium]|nr:hypothetical protein [Anaerolineae bacterium]